MDRALSLLQNDPIKTASFRDGVSAYRTSNITATQLLDTFISLFSVPAAELGKLIKELAEIYENETKRHDLLKAWNDWRAINEDYPSLPGPSGVLPSSSAAAAGNGGHRVLRLKNSTVQSSRSAVSKQSSWGNAATANPFPPMPAASSTRAGERRGAAAWLATSTSASSSRPSFRPGSQPPATSSSSSATPSAVAFPALPAAAKPNTTMFGLTKGSVRWDGGGGVMSGGNPWGRNVSEAPKGEERTSTEKDGNGNGTGKGKGKKQTVYRFG
jgi:E3 ubiquitin-protein ligase ZNF598